MTFNQASCIVSASTLVVAWWLSGYDAKLARDGGWGDRLRRFFRCAVTVAGAELILWCVWRYTRENDNSSGLIPIPVILLLAYLWAGAVTEILSRGFGSLFDSDGRRAFDPAKGEAGLRQLTQLAEEGRQAEALKLSEKLRKSGNTDVIVLEALMQRLGVDEKHADKEKSLRIARELQSEGRFGEAERVLMGLIKKHPDYTEAAVFLVKIYAQDIGDNAKAAVAFESLKERSGTSPGMVQFAQSLLGEIKTPAPELLRPSETVPVFRPEQESVDDLIVQKRYGTAITALKDRLRDYPNDFGTWARLAEVNGRYCGSMQQVENIIRLLQTDPHFTPEQVQSLRTRLEEWRMEWKMHKVASNPAQTGQPVVAAVAAEPIGPI